MLRLPILACLSLMLFVSACTSPTTAEQPMAPAAADVAGDYEIDPAHTSLYFKVEHLGISDVYGRFNELDGEFTLGNRSRFGVTIKTASIDTGIPQRDAHLRTADFFDAEEHPDITYRTTGVDVDGGSYTLNGEFTMHGQTRELVLPLTLRGVRQTEEEQRVGFAGSVVIDRRDWGIDGFQGAVGNDVELMISFEGVKQ